MSGKLDDKVPKPKGDGKHCDLCGCSFPAVRCDKCGSQIFCLSCDDMYHRHPKRRFHLRKAVNPTPTPQARPVLPMKVSQLTCSPGDPSKMPLPPPRKKKPGKSFFFDSFRRGSPSSDNSPPIPKKEYSWTDRLGSIRKFMSNRPLPPLPKDAENQEPQEQRNSPPIPRKNDMSFIHKRVDDKPPQLPHRTQSRSPYRKLMQEDFTPLNKESPVPDSHAHGEWSSASGAPTNNFSQQPETSPTEYPNGQANRDSSERELPAGRFRSRSLQDGIPRPGISNIAEQPNLSPTVAPDGRGYSTLKRPSGQAQDVINQCFVPTPGDNFTGMHTSSSVTELHALDSPTVRGYQQFPNFPIPPHYPHPYPMYPHYPNYPQYFGTSFANLSTALPNTEGELSDHSEASSFSGKKYHKHSAFGMKAKRSQSVMHDRMAYPPQYYPFGGFPPQPPLPGYGAAPWGQSDHPIEPPSSPSTSVRSFGRSHRSRHRKKKIAVSDNNNEDDDRMSISSPRSRTTSSSDRLRKRKPPKKFERSASPSSLTSSEVEKENQVMEDRLSPKVHTELPKGDGYQTKQDKKKVSKEAAKSEHKNKQHGSKMKNGQKQIKADENNFSPKFKKKYEEILFASSESMDVTEEQVEPLMKENKNIQEQEDNEMKTESNYHSEEGAKGEKEMSEERNASSVHEDQQWQCEHCTFINSAEHRICLVCCKTKPGSVVQSDPNLLGLPEMRASSSAAASPDIPALNTTSESLTSDTAKEYLTPPVAAEDDSHSTHSENEGENFAKLNSDLEEAEKELSRGLMELMKLKEESEIAGKEQPRRRLADNTSTEIEARKTPSIPIEPKLAAVETHVAFPQLTEITQASIEKINHDLNAQEVPNVSFKSVGTDSIDFDLITNQAHVVEHTDTPTMKPTNFCSYIENELSPSNSFSVITSQSPTNEVNLIEKPTVRRDSSCQTYQEDKVPMKENEIPPVSHTDNMDFQYPYNRAESMKSPHLPPVAPSSYRGFSGRNQGLMHRSHSRSSLFGDRYGDSRGLPPEFDNLGFGFGPSPMYRSISRSSLTGDYSDPWMSDFRALRRPDFYLSMEELVERRRLESKRAQGLELVRMIREAEQQGFTADDIHVALSNCGKQNPVDWLQTNWRSMVDTVVTLATNYGKDKHENDIGVLSENEARDALRMHKGNIWAAVTECVEGRQRKFLELKARGNFSTKEIVDALTKSEGNVELAYTRMSATTLKPFLMRIWGDGSGVENLDGAVCDPREFLNERTSGLPKDPTPRAGNVPYVDAELCSDQEDWDDDDDVEEEVSWNDEEEDEMECPENFNIEPQIVNREKLGFAANHITTPESDSEYCDAFDPTGGDARSATSTSTVDEMFFVSPDSGLESPKNKKKGTSFLSRLAALRKNKKPDAEDVPENDDAHNEQLTNHGKKSDSHDTGSVNEQTESKMRSNDSNSTNSETNKIYSPLNILKQTFSAIKDSVIGSNNKNETKHSRSITEARTIIVHDRAPQEALLSDENLNNRSQNADPLKVNMHVDEISRKSSEDTAQYKETKHVQIHTDENLKDNVINEILTTNYEAPISLDKIPEKQQKSSTNFEPEILNSADGNTNAINNLINELESDISKEKSAESSSKILQNNVLTENSGDGKMDDGKCITNDVLSQPQDYNESPTDMETGTKDNSLVTKQLPSLETSDKKDKSPIPQQSVVFTDKSIDNVTSVGLTQSSLPASSEKLSPNEEAVDGRSTNDLERNSLLQNGIIGVTDDKVPTVSEAEKLPDTAVIKSSIGVTDDKVPTVSEAEKLPDTAVIKTSDVKLKTKKQKEGLRLKIPNLGKTANSDIPKSQLKPDEQKDKSLVAATNNLDTDLKLDEKQKQLKTEKAEVKERASKSHLVPAEENYVPQKLIENEISDSNSLATNVIEKIESGTSQESKNIHENEFHHMASKITEKMENCLEVLNSSETGFLAESQQDIPPRSEEEQSVSVENDTTQIETKVFLQNSETVKQDADIISANVPDVQINHNKERKPDADVKSPSLSLNQNEKSYADSGSQITDTTRDVSVSPVIYSSSDIVEQHATLDVKALEQPITNNYASTDENKSVTNKISEKPTSDGAGTTNLAEMKSSVSQIELTRPTTLHHEGSTEVPVIFPGVKAKTFTGAVNKKAKIQLSGSDKKQKLSPVISTTLKLNTGVTHDKTEVSKNKKDFLSEKKTPADSIGDQHENQSHQNEHEKQVHSINISNEEIIPPSVLSDQYSQKAPNENENETSPSVQTEDNSSESAHAQAHGIFKTEEKPLTETAITTTIAVSDVKLQGKENINTSITEPDSTLVKISGSVEKELEIENTMATANSKTPVSTLKNHEKGKGKKSDLAALNDEPPVSTQNKISDSQPKVQNKKNDLDVVSSDSPIPTTSKDSGGLQKEPDKENDIAVSNNKTAGGTSSKISDSQPNARDKSNYSADTNSVTEVSSSNRFANGQGKNQDMKNISPQASSETSIPSTNKKDELNTEEVKETTLSVQEDSVPSSPTVSGDKRPASRVETLKHSFNDGIEGQHARSQSPLRPQSPFGRMTSLTARKEAIAQERSKEIRNTPTVEKKPWFIEKVQPPKPSLPKRSIKQQLEFERKIRKLVSERKCRTYRKAEIVVQLLELNFAEEEAFQAAHECSTLEQAISYLQQECLLCAGMYPVGQIVSMIHCPHKACKECIKAYFTIQIRDRTIMELLCPFCNEPDISDEDVAQDYFNHLDILLKKLVETEIHELFQRKLRDRVLMKDPNFRWCSQCSSGFIAMPNLKRLICPDCNAITCAKCRRPWEREHEGVSCEAFATWKDANDPEAQSAGLAKLLQEDGIDCPNCHFRYTLAKGGCMHFRCIQCQHDFCSGCSKPFKMGQKCGVSDYCVKLGLHAHHPRNCLFYLRDKEPEDLQRLLELNEIDYNKDPPEGMELKSVCQVMEQKETPEGLVDDICGKEVLEGQAGLCRVHYVEYLGQLVNKHKIDPIQIFCNDDLELVLRRASKRLPAKSYRDTEIKYREKLVQLIQEELPLELSEGS